MYSINHKRRESLLFREVSQIITEELNNSNISYPTVTGVKLSKDLSHLVVYVTFERNNEKSLKALMGTKGFVKKRIAKVSNLRKIPDVKFEIDKSIEMGQRIESIIREDLQKTKKDSKK